ncbi:DNA-3-methyladenine glycosylase [Lactococcus nasutitermitis]|uniref:Putative 3-methyladenine DNA glycosylase n=1 Tax=Lactococcus nasutitermitis TaxID=1652957 RepID=A0ABV9JDM9_9LACT|nr:DNA-3-methyladenine glycosylase [Lactococcus nasutitermitis]
MEFTEVMATDTIGTAKALLGMALEHNGKTLGWIVETEAYLFPEDMASHSFAGRRTPRNEAMYLSDGHWYVYQIYGHQMLNLVTCAENVAEAVLIRALELPSGEILANGPGKLTALFGLDKRFDKQNLTDLRVVEAKNPLQIASRSRIGINCVEPWKSAALNFYVAGNENISRYAKGEMQTVTWKNEQ